MTLIDFVFPKLRSPKTWSDKCLKSPVSEDPSASIMLKVPKLCWNLHQCRFILFNDHFHLSWKKSLLLTCQILGLLVNTSAADEKYPLLKRDSLTITFQMQLSQKQKTFSESFAAFLKFRLNFKFIEKKYDPHRFCIAELMDCVNLIR